jgi:anti-sigma factor RsiW
MACPEFEGDFSDYHDGTLPPERRAALEAHLAAHAECREEYDRFKEAVSALSGLRKSRAPRDLSDRVADTIHRRSAGRFFGRRAFGDRIPYQLFAGIGLVLLVALYLVLRWSGTGTVHDTLQRHEAPPIPDEARQAVPQP